jgi:hypothetical protein
MKKIRTIFAILFVAGIFMVSQVHAGQLQLAAGGATNAPGLPGYQSGGSSGAGSTPGPMLGPETGNSGRPGSSGLMDRDRDTGSTTGVSP